MTPRHLQDPVRAINTYKLDVVFSFENENWKTGDAHSPPDAKDIDGGVDSLNHTVATLLPNMGAVTKCPGNNRRARKDITHRQTNRPGELGLKVTKPTPQPKVDVHRVAGAPVFMGAEITPLSVSWRHSRTS